MPLIMVPMELNALLIVLPILFTRMVCLPIIIHHRYGVVYIVALKVMGAMM